MSTTINVLFPQSDIDRCLELQLLLHDLLNGMNLLLPEQFARRMNALDELDAVIGNLDLGALEALPEPELIARAMALSSRVEAANEMVYQATHAEIAVLGTSLAMNH